MKKLSVIRGESVAECPYGLDITRACKDVGDTILTMQALQLADNQDAETIKKHNKIIYLTRKIGERCPFANEIMEKFDKVDCSWGDVAAGEGVHYLTPSPLYPRIFVGDGLGPGSPNREQTTYDPRQYFDAPERGINVPFGLYSIFANDDNRDKLLKIAAKYTNKNINIKDKLAFLQDKYFDALKLIVAGYDIIKLNEQQLEQLLFIINDWVV